MLKTICPDIFRIAKKRGSLVAFVGTSILLTTACQIEGVEGIEGIEDQAPGITVTDTMPDSESARGEDSGNKQSDDEHDHSQHDHGNDSDTAREMTDHSGDHDEMADHTNSDTKTNNENHGSHEGHSGPISYEPNADCGNNLTRPVGQSSPRAGAEAEPMGPIWCFDLGEAPQATAVVGSNSWVDTFNSGDCSLKEFNDGDAGYRLFDSPAGGPPTQTLNFFNHCHPMADVEGGQFGGTTMRPDQSFRFEDGKFIVEADVAADVADLGAADAWTEITITDASSPNTISDAGYAYGQFGQNTAIGCRLNPGSHHICSHMAPEGTPITQTCRHDKQRHFEINFFLHCGNETIGGHKIDEANTCGPDEPDKGCRDRFRMEITKDSLTLFVNGAKYMETSGWPADKQLPDSFLNGEIYVYLSNRIYRNEGRVVRFHWGGVAVNGQLPPQDHSGH